MIQVSTHIPGYAPVAHGLHAVGRDADFINPVFIRLKIFRSSRSYFCFSVQHQDAFMRSTQTHFIFGANHAVAFYIADFCHFHGDGFAVDGVNSSAYSCHQHFLTGLHIWCTTNYLQRLAVAGTNFSKGELICIGMFFSGQYFTNHKTFQPAFDFFIFFKSLHFKPDGK